MSTTINVTADGDQLLDRVKAQQQASRLAALELQKRKALEQDRAKLALEKDDNDNSRFQDPLPYRRDPAAFATGSAFVPLAINWRGVVATTENSYTTQLSYRYEIYTNTLSVCTPNPVRLSVAGKKLVEVAQETHISDFSYRVSNLPNNVSDYIGSGHVTSVSYLGPADEYIPLGPAPNLPVNRIAPTGFQPSIVVASKGRVLFAAISMPPEHSIFNNRLSYYPWLNGGQPVSTLIDDYPFDIQPGTINLWYGRSTTPYFRPAGQQVPTPYVFLRIQGSNIQSKSAVHNHPDTFGDFYSANAFADDPSKDMRGLYTGEVRVEGQRARFLRLKNTNTGLYQDFPFGDLHTFISPVTGLPVIAAPYELVVHTHQLPTYSTPAQLAGLLAQCVDPNSAGGLYIGPSIERRQQIPVSFFASTAAKLDKTGPDTLTEDSFFLVLL